MSENFYPLPFLKNKSVVVLGLGNSGQTALQAAKKAGAAEVLGVDDNAKSVQRVQSKGLPATSIPDKAFINDQTIIVISPGVPTSYPRPHPILTEGKAHQATMTSDIDLFFRNRPRGKVIGVSGTNGKSSTVSLIHFILKHCGHDDTQLGGNIGTPILSLKPDSKHTVLELSSYQIETSPHLNCDVSILLKIAPDHLDRYANFDVYAKSKLRLLYPPGEGLTKGFKRPSDMANASGGVKYSLYDSDDPLQLEFVEAVKVNKEPKGLEFVPLSVTSVLRNGFAILDGNLYDTWSRPKKLHCLTKQHLMLPKQALLAAYASLRVSGHDAESVFGAASLWPGLSHRLEVIPLPNSLNDNGHYKHIIFINDSKAPVL